MRMRPLPKMRKKKPLLHHQGDLFMTSFSIEENLKKRGSHCDQIFGEKLVVIRLLQNRLVGLPLHLL